MRRRPLPRRVPRSRTRTQLGDLLGPVCVDDRHGRLAVVCDVGELGRSDRFVDADGYAPCVDHPLAREHVLLTVAGEDETAAARLEPEAPEPERSLTDVV